MAAYSKRLELDVQRWVGEGLIDRATGEALVADARAHERKSFSFGFILMMMAALLLCAALLLVVASNWQAVPRPARVGLLFALMAVGYVGGALLKPRGHAAVAEAMWLVAAAAFGGSIALIGQMYHLAGDEQTALLTWCAGTALAGAALRSGPLTIAATGIALAWLFTGSFDLWGDRGVSPAYPAVAAALWLLSFWTGSTAARHVLLLSLVAYAAILAFDHDVTAVATILCLVSVLLFAASVLAPDMVERVARLDGRLPLHALIGFLVGAALLQVEHVENTGVLVVAALVVFAAIAVAVLFAGRLSRGLRWIAYLGFALELAFVYVATVGTMLDTAGVFLTAALVLGLVGFVVIRVERRMRATP